ncbi:hypothetical protein [Tolumonas lignilytica]|uniref:hypothetical protein n=1 Tax=Tolumonas lignilytica TaxID=1283284 RepID=UPI000466B724|nr:hypothetical protein [Tolumonas lignilytica]
MKNGNKPAAPTTGEISKTDEVWSYQVGDNARFQFTGLTKREMFAMHFMSASISTGNTYNGFIEDSISYADSLLDKLESSK